MKLQEALKTPVVPDELVNFVTLDIDAFADIQAAARSVVESTNIPDYEAAAEVLHTEFCPASNCGLVSRGVWIESVKPIIDAAVKGRRLVEWEDTDE